jgi:hypothetical protein
MTTGVIVRARTDDRSSIHRVRAARACSHSHGLLLMNCCSEYQTVGEPDTDSATLRIDFLPSVSSSPLR